MTESLLLDDYQPRSELVVPASPIAKARYPVIDAHNHPTYPGFGWQRLKIEQILQDLDQVNVATVVNLSGGWGEELKRNIGKYDHTYPGRFITYCNIDFEDFGSTGWVDRTVTQLRADVQAGARGLKIYKELGLHYRDQMGQLVLPDDPRLSEVWEAAGELGIPVTIHTADPVAFFRPLDRFNERWEELHEFPDWHFGDPKFPTFETLIESLYHTIESHPRTNFITAHVGCYPENLGFVSRMMDRYPNFYTDIAARIAELGRAPYSARSWFLKYPDRILFGTDLVPRQAIYQIHFRFLETADEYFEYHTGPSASPQGRWRIYGLYLPDPVLQRVYHDNAARLYKL